MIQKTKKRIKLKVETETLNQSNETSGVTKRLYQKIQ